jgi:shikimate 5-dehydrogenase
MVAGAQVTVVNRDPERGQRAADLLKRPVVPLEEFQPAAFDLIVNATSLGRAENDPVPFALDGVQPGTVVVDLVYQTEPTALLRAAAGRGLATVDGREVLVYQALGQFRWMTGREMPVAPALRIVGLDGAPGDRS